MIESLRAFFRRAGVIELAGAIAAAWAFVQLLQSLIQGLVVTPILTPDDEGGRSFFGDGYFGLGGRVFDWIHPLTGVAVLVLVAVAVAALLRASTASERELVDCPHCLESIPAGASVCSFCTRDVA